MEKFVSKMSEYLKMDSEIPYQEFSEFFQDYYGYLGEQLDNLPQEELVKARFISSIILSNSQDRSRRKDDTAKRFKKMSEKSKIWTDAITYRLTKMGMTQAQIDKEMEAFSDSM